MIYITILAYFLMGQAKNDAIPHLDDETSIVRIKANPEKYVGKTFIISGAIQISDYYNYFYRNAKLTHYSLRFVESGTTIGNVEIGTETCSIYLRKNIGAAIVDMITKSEEEHKTE